MLAMKLTVLECERGCRFSKVQVDMDAGFLRQRATSGLDSFVRASTLHCIHGAFESEPLQFSADAFGKSTKNLVVPGDLHK